MNLIELVCPGEDHTKLPTDYPWPQTLAIYGRRFLVFALVAVVAGAVCAALLGAWRLGRWMLS